MRRDIYQKLKAAGFCVRCAGPRDTALLACSACSAKQISPTPAYLRQRYHTFKSKGLCVKCGDQRDGATLKCIICQDRTNRHHKSYEYKLKHATFTAYGGVYCRCCGETEIRFLTLDHVNNDGFKHKVNGRERATGCKMYLQLKAAGYPNDPPLQVLCYNCNCGRSCNKGICPHKD